MCRNIKTLANFAPPATDDEIQASALQFVRKLSGFSVPSQANAAAFDHAVQAIAAEARVAREPSAAAHVELAVALQAVHRHHS